MWALIPIFLCLVSELKNRLTLTLPLPLTLPREAESEPTNDDGDGILFMTTRTRPALTLAAAFDGKKRKRDVIFIKVFLFSISFDSLFLVPCRGQSQTVTVLISGIRYQRRQWDCGLWIVDCGDSFIIVVVQKKIQKRKSLLTTTRHFIHVW